MNSHFRAPLLLGPCSTACSGLSGHGKLGLVRLEIDHEDEEGFIAARDMLLGRFSRWLTGRDRYPVEEIDELVGDVSIALDWKWSFGDGELATWRTGDVAEFLLEWCPWKLTVSQADCITVPPAVLSFLSFLDDQDLLGPGSAPVDRLVDMVMSLTDEFVVAMGDRSKFGLAKSMFTAASDEGVDTTDPAELEAWMARFNDRPEAERHRLLPTRRSRRHRPVVAFHRSRCRLRTTWRLRGRRHRSSRCFGILPPMSAQAVVDPEGPPDFGRCPGPG